MAAESITVADPFSEFKAKQREAWAHYIPLEAVAIAPAGRLVAFSGLRPGDKVLDVACGTGVVAITARRAGATVTGLDLTPKLLERARENAEIAGLKDIEWREGDAEALPFKDGTFDVVLSQFGHIFAPRPDVTIREMLRVLKPGGRIAFTTWPPEHAIGRLFALSGKYLPPVPGATPPGKWGDVDFVRTQLGDKVRDLTFDRGTMNFPALSLAHHRHIMEQTAGPVIRILQSLQNDPEKLAQFRREMESAVEPFYRENVVRQDFLQARAIKA